jgi:hypothetical protein
MSAKFLHNSGAMRGHGLEALIGKLRNGLESIAVCDQMQDLLFAAGTHRCASGNWLLALEDLAA